MIPSYIDVLGERYPQLNATALGDGTVYSTITVSNGELPPQEELDTAARDIIRQRIWRAIQADRDVRKSGGVKVGNNWFHSDDTSRIQQLALVMFGAGMPTGIMWKTMQGTFVQMTPTLAMQIFQTIAGSDQAIFGRAEFHRAMMSASGTPHLYDYSTGWPQTYAEWAATQPPAP